MRCGIISPRQPEGLSAAAVQEVTLVQPHAPGDSRLGFLFSLVIKKWERT